MKFIQRLYLMAITAGVICLPASYAFAMGVDDYDIIRNSCQTDLQLSNSGCDCLIAKVKAELSDTQREFLVANVLEDPTRISAAQGNLGEDEILPMMEFMTTVPQFCQTQ